MEKKKINFFIKAKRAMTNFDEYRSFSEEKKKDSVKYFIKLVLLFTLVVTIALTIRVINEVSVVSEGIKNTFPEFSFQNGNLLLEGEQTRIVKGDSSGYFGLIIDSKEESLENINEVGDYQRVIAFLKDKMVVKDTSQLETSMTYEQINNQINLNNINKQSIINFLSRE